MEKEYVILPAKYAKKMFKIQTRPDGSGYKTRADRLAASLANGRYTHRERAWIMSEKKAGKFEDLYNKGFDACIITGELIQP